MTHDGQAAFALHVLDDGNGHDRRSHPFDEEMPHKLKRAPGSQPGARYVHHLPSRVYWPWLVNK
jgi:hypothetical protein